MVVSPISVKLVLTMLYEGAAGNTALELEETLQLPARMQARKRFSAIIDSLLVSRHILLEHPIRPTSNWSIFTSTHTLTFLF
jgi:serine protease inhibitor